jgi:hypothetical protein
MDASGRGCGFFDSRTRARKPKCHTRHAHRDAFFTTLNVGKGAVCKFAGNFGLDGESAGGNGTVR